MVGQFGVGLKDTLATFHRNRIGVRISSPHGTTGLVEQSTHGFGDVVTLHATIDASADIDGRPRGPVVRRPAPGGPRVRAINAAV